MSEKTSITREAGRAFEKQMRNWEFSRTQQPDTTVGQTRRFHPFVTISRCPGCGSEEIAAEVGKRLGWPVYDRQILEEMAGQDPVRSCVYRALDERDPGLLEEACRSLFDAEFHRNDYFQRLRSAVRRIVLHGPAILVGRGADLILPRDHGLRVRLIAPRDVCIAAYAHDKGLDLHHARRQWDRTERERVTWLRNHFHIEADAPERYDLTINTARLKPEQVIGLILAGLGMTCGSDLAGRKA